MTSVLYSSGLNYQGRNPMGSELRAIERRVNEIEGAFSGIRTNMETFLASQAKPAVPAGPTEADKKIAELKVQVDGLQATMESFREIIESLKSAGDILKARVDKADAAVASASAAASQAKAIATSAAADAASAAASAAAAVASA